MDVIKKNVILLGDGAVGKTSLIRRFVTDQFSDKYITTIGSKVTKKEVYVGSGDDVTQVVMLIWDILGQKGYRYTQALSFGGIEGALLVADVTRADTLESLKEYWIPSILSVTGHVHMIFLGNKWDLKDEAEFGLGELSKLADMYEGVDIGERALVTSTKTGEGVHEAFESLARALVKMTSKAVDELGTHQYIIDKDEIHDLLDVTDHIIADFCNQFGEVEGAGAIVKQQVKEVGLDINHPDKKRLVEFVNALAGVEKSLRTPDEVAMNRTRRLYLVNQY